MLRRAEKVSVSHHTSIFSNKGSVHLHIGATVHPTFAKVLKLDYQAMLNHTVNYPVSFGRVGERNYWLFQNRWFWENDRLTPEQVHALLVTRDQREHARISRAQTMVAMNQQPVASVRGAIPDDVKQFVWQRDQGRCRQCGSNVELQFDHVIPVAYGGASTLENLQILCGPCNRRKGASV